MAKKNVEPLRGLVSLRARPGFLVRRLHQIGVAIFTDEMADLELTPVQYGAMSIVGMNPGIDQSALGEELGTDRANTTDVINRLVNNGYALRAVSPKDRRMRRVYLTDHGRDIVVEANQRLKNVRSRFLSPLKPADREIFLDLMIELIEGNNSLGRAAWRFNAGGQA
ncbi:MAG TPA: MarR family transcriptional regulator [Pseudolabrys sp.]|jgi:DNA-binding MarR family transcriptional regulator|nr:MarR family transcriptional regulator [Pseudolabrys sp.]